MAQATDKCIVMRVHTRGGAYYLCNRHGGVTLDVEVYQPYILQVADAKKYGNFGEGYQTGACHVVLMNGEQWHQGNYMFDITRTWNNQLCEIKLCDPGTHTKWADCEDYYSGIMKKLKASSDTVEYDVDDADYRDDRVVPTKTAEDLVVLQPNLTEDDVPEKYRGARIPMQFGNLDNASEGVFGKGVTLSQRIGLQEVMFDERILSYLPHVGVWERGTERFFVGRAESVVNTVREGEYSVGRYRNRVAFQVKSGTTLIENLGVITGVDSFRVADWTKLQWADEDDVDWQSHPELLSINILAIDNELMMLIAKPAAATIWVERGYNGTTATEHHVGTPIYQCAKFSARNLLSFSEKFLPSAVSNQWYGTTVSGGAPTTQAPDYFIAAGTWGNLIDGDLNTYLRLACDITIKDRTACFVNFDLRFPHIEDTYPVYGTYCAIKYATREEWVRVVGGGGTSVLANTLAVYDPGYNTNFSHSTIIQGIARTARAIVATVVRTSERNTAGVTTSAADKYTIIDRTPWVNTGTRPRNNASMDIRSGDAVDLGTITDLNKKFKLTWMAYASPFAMAGGETNRYQVRMDLYEIAFWIDFFVDFTKHRIVAPLKGRLITNLTSWITTGSDKWQGRLCENPCDVLVDVLTDEMQYGYNEFDKTTWQSVRDYYRGFPSSPEHAPAVACSYGINEEERGWDWCQRLASHFMLALVRNDDRTIRPVNLHQLQSKGPTNGYPSLTARQISVDDILIGSGRRRLNIQQTGTDRLRNAVIVYYKRNNSTDEYQESYEVPDDYVLPESGLTLAEARLRYYNGEKTETLRIDSPFIYGADDAQHLGEWHINDKAEVGLWAEFVVDHEHYTLVNGLSRQYRIGDLIYLDGTHSGVTLDSDRKWVVRDVIKKDQGRELEIHAKSIEPVSEYSSTSEDVNSAINDTNNAGIDGLLDATAAADTTYDKV